MCLYKKSIYIISSLQIYEIYFRKQTNSIKKQHTSFLKNRGAEGGVGIASLCEIMHNNRIKIRIFHSITAKPKVLAVIPDSVKQNKRHFWTYKTQSPGIAPVINETLKHSTTLGQRTPYRVYFTSHPPECQVQMHKFAYFFSLFSLMKTK